MLSFLLALFVFLATLYAAVTLVQGMQKMVSLQDIPNLDIIPAPRVSLIVPACNEEKTIEPAIQSFLQQDYPHLEVIVVNDRSVDATKEVLLRLQAEYPKLNIMEVTELPKGWLGKANALQMGSEHASGEYLIFTDADILMEKTTITRAVHHFHAQHLDHLCLIFKNIAEGWLLNGLILDSGGGLFLLFKPWLAKLRESRSFIGIGAFNMVRKSAYVAIGGHSSFKMHPIDDIMLGKKMKQNGFRQDCLLGYDFVSVRWYESVRAMINGLMKNVFSIINFRLLYVPGMLTTIFLVGILPLWGVFLTDGYSRLFFFLAVVLRLFLLYFGARSLNLSVITVPAAVIAPYFTFYIVVKSVFLTLRNNGIMWRGTHYSLTELRKNEPILF